MTIIQIVNNLSLTNQFFHIKGDKMRGINKLVIEIKPENEYFEKAVLFLSPDKIYSSQNEISFNAEKILSEIKADNYYNKSKKISVPLFIFIGAAAGSFISWLIFYLISIVNL